MVKQKNKKKVSGKIRNGTVKNINNHVKEKVDKKSVIGESKSILTKLFNSKLLFYLLFLIIGFVYILSYYNLTSDLQSIPTCLYGCDYYFENGILLDYSNNPSNLWQSSSHDWLGHINSLPKGDVYIKAFFSNFTTFSGLDFWKNTIFISYFYIMLGLIFWFILYKKIFKDNYIGLFLTLISYSLVAAPYFKYRNYSNVLLPLLVLFLINLFTLKKATKEYFLNLIAFIVIFVLYANAHAMALFMALFLIFFGYLFFILLPFKKDMFSSFKKFKSFFNEKIMNINSLGVIFATMIGLIITFLLGWWYQVIFVYGGKTNAFKFDIHLSFLDWGNYFSYTLVYMKSIFFNFTNYYLGFISLAIISSILVLIFVKNKSIEKRYILWVMTTFLFGVFHYIITVPLLSNHLSPRHGIALFFSLFSGFMIGYLLLFIKNRLNSLNKLERFQKLNMLNYFYILLILLILISVQFNVAKLLHRGDGSFWKSGENEIQPVYKEFDNFINQNDYDPSKMIVLTSNELSFAIHGVEGVKLLTGRQSHFFIFGDFQKYWMDAAIIFYGNKSESRREVLSYYSKLAKEQDKELYLYWDYYWVNSEWQQLSNGGLHPFDPLRFEHSEERVNVLVDNQIKFFVQKDAIFEPSAQNNPNVYKMDIIYISPENYVSLNHPWHNDLDNYLEEVWSYEQNAQELGKLYKIKLD